MLGGLALLLAAQAAGPLIPNDLAAQVASYDRAQLDGNCPDLERLLADDYLLVNSSGHTENKAQLIADYTAAGFDLKTLVIEQPIARVWAGGAVMGGIGTLRGVDGAKPFEARLRFADVWAKRDGRWQVIYTHAERAPPATSSSTPTLRLIDPAALTSIMTFAPPEPRLHMASGGEIWWRADVDLPATMKLNQVIIAGYAPVTLKMADGTCFKVEFTGPQPKMDEAVVSKSECPAPPGRTAAAAGPPPRSGVRYMGKAWDLDIWNDPARSETLLTQVREGRSRTVLTTRMRVLAVGAMGSPDTPMTEVTLAGYVGRQLTLATVMLYIP
ncbi:uncharacterized protein DUF4440 [Sphingomonas sp. F9_3S_D5_B_2]